MNFVCAHRTDVGKIRDNNEDHFISVPELRLFVVADGMGGHNAGEVASQKTCEVIQRHIEENREVLEQFNQSHRSKDLQSVSKLLAAAVEHASKVVYRMAGKNKEQRGMGCTCTALLLLDDGKGVLAHVGDSRLYMLRRGRVHQLTEDHTFVGDLLKRGMITPEQAHDHPNGNVLTRAVGVQANLVVDTMIFDLDPGDVFLLCSDGLHGYFENDSALLPYFDKPDLQEVIDDLINFTLSQGANDNVTALAVLMSPMPGEDYIAAEERLAILKKVPLFSHLKYNELVKVLGLTENRTVAAQTELLTEGERGSELFILLDGAVDVLKAGDVIANLEPGVHIGEMALVDNAPRSATIRTQAECHVLSISRPDFFTLIRAEPVIATKLLWSFVQVMSTRLRDTNDALLEARTEELDDDSFEILFDDDE